MGIGKRLRTGIEERMEKGSIRAFHREMKDKGVPGSSYPNIHRYLSNEREPSLEFLRHAAEVLGVRYEWLVADMGGMTEEDELLRRRGEGNAEDAVAAAGKAASEREAEDALEPYQRVLRDVQKGFGFERPRLIADPYAYMEIHRTWGRMLKAKLLPTYSSPEEDGEAPGIRAYLSSAPPAKDWIAYYIGQTLRGPFLTLPMSPEDIPIDSFRDIIISTCQTIHRVVDGYVGREPAPIPEPTEEA